MALEGNRAGYSISAQDFFSDLGLAPSDAPKKQTISDARTKIKWEGFEFLLGEARRDDLEIRWHKHIVRIADGSKINLPNSPELRERFAIPNTKVGPGFYPQAWLVTLINSTSGQPIAARVGCHKECSERDLMLGLLSHCHIGDVLLLDRGLGGARVYLECAKRGLFFLHRVRTSGETVALYVQDFLASQKQSALYGVEAEEESGEKVMLWIRLVRGPRDSEGKTIVFATNLLDEEVYSNASIRELYQQRWGIETVYNRSKNLLHLEKFHARSYNGIMQEIFANLLVMSLASAVDVEAGKKVGIDRATAAPNFKAVVHVVRRYFSILASINVISKKKAADLAALMVEEAALIIYEKRPGRSYPRVSKQPIKNHNLCKRKKLVEYENSRALK